jgi:hypothetical protein
MPHPRLVFQRVALLAALALPLSACMMNSPPSRGAVGAQELLSNEAMHLNVQKVVVNVPRSLTVSEANTIKPAADIVWHGDAQGDRYAQVQKITQEAMDTGTSAYRSGYPVVVDVQVIRFHALTPRTRKSIGGKHELEYTLTLREAASGKVLRQVERVSATVRGAGGMKARAEEAAGRTEKVVIREALAISIQKELMSASQALGQPAIVARASGTPATAQLQ